MNAYLNYPAAEDEMVRRHHRLNGREFEQTLGDGEGQGSLACCSPWGRRELDTTDQLNNSRFFSHSLLVALVFFFYLKCAYLRQGERGVLIQGSLKGLTVWFYLILADPAKGPSPLQGSS